MKTIIKYFKTAPMSKKLTLIVTAAWLVSVATGHILLALLNINLSSMIEFVQTAFVIILAFYFVKSGAENIIGVKNTTDFIQKVVETTGTTGTSTVTTTVDSTNTPNSEVNTPIPPLI